MLDAMFLIQRSLYLRLKQTRHPHCIMDLYVGSFWGNRQWGKPTVRGNNIFPIPFPNSALAITSAGIGGWHTVDVSIVNNNSYSVLGWATDSPSTARTSLPSVIAIGF